MPVEAFLINPAKLKKNRRRKRRKSRRRNPLGEEAMILGANPRRKRKRRRARRNAWTGQSRKHAAAARKGWRRRRRRASNYPRRRRRTYARRYNPPAVYAANSPRRRRRRRGRRRYRRNPAAMLRVRALDLRDPITIVTPLLTGVAAKMATERIPNMMNLTGNQRMLAQLGIAVGGGYMLQGVIGPIGATVWLAVAGAEIASTFVNKMLTQLQISGIGYPALGAYPQDFMGFSAYPDETMNYPV